MADYEALFKTFLGIKKRNDKLFPAYIYDVIGRVLGIILSIFIVLLLISFLSFALKPFNVTITRVVELFWRDYTFVIAVPVSIPSIYGTLKELMKSRDKVFIRVTVVYFLIILTINILIAVFGILPMMRLIGV